MKKVMRCMCMIAVVALAFTSCKKNEEKSTIVASTQEFVMQTEDGDRAYIENFGNHHIHFEVGDMCMLFNINETVPTQSHACAYEAIEEGDVVHFVNAGWGEIAEDIMDGFYGFYPGGPGQTITELNQGENKCKFHVEPVQVYRVDKVSLKDMYMAARVLPDEAAHLSEANFNFKNVCGILALRPYEAAQRTVTSIEVVDNAFNLNGWVELIVPEIDGDELQGLFNNFDMSNPTYVNTLHQYLNRIGYQMTDGDDSMLLACTGEESPNGVQLGSTKASTPVFNIVLRPMALSQGCHMIFSFDDGSVKDVEIPAGAITMKPNTLRLQGLNLDNY